jgi:excisionase family DNA binding protein
MNPISIPKQDQKGLATYGEAQRFLAVSRTTLWRLARTGAIRPIRIGRSVRFGWADLHALARGEQ